MSKEKNISRKEIEEALKLKLTGEKTAEVLGISKNTLYDRMRKFGLCLDKTPSFDINVFDIIDTEEKAYWLGFLYADGYVCGYHKQVEVSLKGEDSAHLVKFSTFLKDTRTDPVKLSVIKSNGKEFARCRYIVGNPHFHERLIQLGCTPKKSLMLTFPDTSVFASENLVIDFIRGYVDGDGSITNTSTGRLQLDIVGTVEFLSGIMKIFPEFKSIYTDKRNPNVHELSCTANVADKVSYRLYENANIYLDRKYQKFAALCKLHNDTSGKNGEG